MRIDFFQNFIDRIRRKIVGLPIMFEKTSLVHLQNIKTAILGSSHLQCAYYPQKDEINLALSSQDLYYSWNLYKKLSEDIENIVVSFSVFSPGHSLIKTRDKKLCIQYKLLYNIDYQYEECAKKFKLIKDEKWYTEVIDDYIKTHSISSDYRGEPVTDRSNNPDKTTKEVALKHLKHNQRKISQMDYCKYILDATKEKNQKLYFVLCPVTEEYRSYLPAKELVFKPLYDLCENYEHVKILDYYDSQEFNKNDFINCHHVNYDGACKLTNFIRNAIYGDKDEQN